MVKHVLFPHVVSCQHAQDRPGDVVLPLTSDGRSSDSIVNALSGEVALVILKSRCHSFLNSIKIQIEGSILHLKAPWLSITVLEFKWSVLLMYFSEIRLFSKHWRFSEKRYITRMWNHYGFVFVRSSRSLLHFPLFRKTSSSPWTGWRMNLSTRTRHSENDHWKVCIQ